VRSGARLGESQGSGIGVAADQTVRCGLYQKKIPLFSFFLFWLATPQLGAWQARRALRAFSEILSSEKHTTKKSLTLVSSGGLP